MSELFGKDLYKICGHGSLTRQGQIHDLESERDQWRVENDSNVWLARHRLEEIDRLKAEMELQKETCKNGFEDRDLWKSRAEKLAEALRFISTDNRHLGMNLNPECKCFICVSKQALSDFEARKQMPSCKGQGNQTYCEDLNCGRRDSSGKHWPMGHPENKP